MLTITDTRPDRKCSGYSRREFLRVGGLGMAGLGLPGLALPRLLQASDELGQIVRGKSVVFLFLNGGPSHIECFDPKMSAPSSKQ